MIRKAIMFIVGVGALVVLGLSLVSLLAPIDAKFPLVDGATRAVNLRVVCSGDGLGGTATWHVSEEPAGESDGWAINDRVLRASYEVRRGVMLLATQGGGVRRFQGRKSLDLLMPWWVAVGASTVLTLFFLFDLIRTRRLRKAAGREGVAAPVNPLASAIEPTLRKLRSHDATEPRRESGAGSTQDGA